MLDDDSEPIEVMFSGMELEQGTELSGVLWFSVESRDGRIARVRSAMDAGELRLGAWLMSSGAAP